MGNLESYERKEAISLYQMRLDGRIGRFPVGYFGDEKNPNRGKIEAVVKYCVDNVLPYKTLDELAKNITVKMLYKYKLSLIVDKLFSSNVYFLFDYVYPNTFKPWQFQKMPKFYWNDENAKDAVKWLVEEHLKYDEKSIHKIKADDFYNNSLSGLLRLYFNDSVYDAVNFAYPGKYKVWEVRVPKKFWTKERAVDATRWLFKEKLGWSDEEITQNYYGKIFKDYNLHGMVCIIYNGNAFNALEDAFPGRFEYTGYARNKELKLVKNEPVDLYKKVLSGEIKSFPYNFFKRKGKVNEKNCSEVTRYMIEEVLKMPLDQIPKKLKVEDFGRCKLKSMIMNCFGSNMYYTIDTAYPGMFERTDFVKMHKETL